MGYKPDAAVAMGIVLVLIAFYLLWRAHRDPSSQINLSTILLDTTVQPPIVTFARFAAIGAFLVSTWWGTILIVQDKMTSEIFIGYMATWAAMKVAGDLAKTKEAGNNVEGEKQ